MIDEDPFYNHPILKNDWELCATNLFSWKKKLDSHGLWGNDGKNNLLTLLKTKYLHN